MSMDTKGYWAIAYTTNSSGARAQKWYHVARVIRVDGKWWGIGRHSPPYSSKSAKQTREDALASGLELMPGLFSDAPSPRYGPRMVWSLEHNEDAP